MSEIVVVASGNELADIMMLSVKAGYPTDHNLEHEQNVAASAPPTCQGIQCHRRNGVRAILLSLSQIFLLAFGRRAEYYLRKRESPIVQFTGNLT